MERSCLNFLRRLFAREGAKTSKNNSRLFGRNRPSSLMAERSLPNQNKSMKKQSTPQIRKALKLPTTYHEDAFIKTQQHTQGRGIGIHLHRMHSATHGHTDAFVRVDEGEVIKEISQREFLDLAMDSLSK